MGYRIDILDANLPFKSLKSFAKSMKGVRNNRIRSFDFKLINHLSDQQKEIVSTLLRTAVGRDCPVEFPKAADKYFWT